jgi:hypothetical protein
MPIGIPKAMAEEHEELHEELKKATTAKGEVGRAAKQMARVLHPHFERENELALPVIGVAREVAEGRVPSDASEALELCDNFKAEYEAMLMEHAKIVKALGALEKAARRARKRGAIEFTRRLKLHAQIEEDLTYPAVLMVGKLLKKG